MHHICSTQLHFPPQEELQSSIENYKAIYSPWLREEKMIHIFASGFAGRTRSPHGLGMNIRLLLSAWNNEIPIESRIDIYNIFKRVLTDIATEYSSRQRSLDL
ncbi:MAG: hypothetical protein ACRCSV_05545 [Chlamydiales bacterium]